MRLFTALFFCLPLLTTAQVGLQFTSDDAMEAYTLFISDPSFRSEDVHLIDNCGQVINEWLNIDRASHHYKLLPTGNLMWIADNERIVELDWDGNTVVDLQVGNNDFYLDYEVVKLENGNYLTLARKYESFSFFENIGYDPFLGSPSLCDMVLEIDHNDGSIVWSWNICEHVIQERDPLAANYGVLSEHPELLNMDGISDFDWENRESFMINGMDYNPELDQIALSVRKMGEVAIIDHSTTTAEASGSVGGKYGKGGDILYRWGNPANYNRGTSEDRILYFQHNPNWIKYGPHAGKLIVYNNGLDRPVASFNDRFSSVEIFNPTMDGEGNYLIDDTNPFLPLTSDVEFSKNTVGVEFYSGYESGTQILPNGNLLLTPYSEEFIGEYTLDGDLVWKHGGENLFRSERYPLDYPAFEGRDLTPGPELWDSSFDCDFDPNVDNDLDGFTFNQGDCNDSDPEVNPDVEEEPYNGVDDDCNADTPDDDLDGDGFPLSIDCDDLNPEVNFLMMEIPYNGIDDDCRFGTPDDDLDGDGYLLENDCDDMNSAINPGATEIPNNDVDEDCDGFLTSINEVNDLIVMNVYPNPVSDLLYIDIESQMGLTVQVANSLGAIIYQAPYTPSIDVSVFDSGLYFLTLRDASHSVQAVERFFIVR